VRACAPIGTSPVAHDSLLLALAGSPRLATIARRGATCSRSPMSFASSFSRPYTGPRCRLRAPLRTSVTRKSKERPPGPPCLGRFPTAEAQPARAVARSKSVTSAAVAVRRERGTAGQRICASDSARDSQPSTSPAACWTTCGRGTTRRRLKSAVAKWRITVSTGREYVFASRERQRCGAVRSLTTWRFAARLLC
jgi:hypothetical protein